MALPSRAARCCTSRWITLLLKHICGGASVGLLAPVQSSARAWRPVPVQGLHVLRIAPQILAPGPEHGIVDMETDGHIGFESQIKSQAQ